MRGVYVRNKTLLSELSRQLPFDCLEISSPVFFIERDSKFAYVFCYQTMTRVTLRFVKNPKNEPQLHAYDTDSVNE